MRTRTSQKIIAQLKKQGQMSPKLLAEYLEISPQALFRQLKKLRDKGQIEKIGHSPRVFYTLQQEEAGYNQPLKNLLLSPEESRVIEENFMLITPLGQIKTGLEGFIHWCHSRKQEAQKTAKEYLKTWKKYERLKKNGVINGLKKAKKTFEHIGLDKLFYLDFYSIERFGKTKLGQMLLYAKQSQNKAFIKQLITSIKPKMQTLIKRHKIDGVCFIPPTVKRQVQLMNELKRKLKLAPKILNIEKINTMIPIPQKTLNKLEDRIENASKTLVVTESGAYKTVLLIDDAVGSGATLNETAKQLKGKGIAKKVIGLAITGSLKGFEVISEV